jgi:hypothetical protein
MYASGVISAVILVLGNWDLVYGLSYYPFPILMTVVSISSIIEMILAAAL